MDLFHLVDLAWCVCVCCYCCFRSKGLANEISIYDLAGLLHPSRESWSFPRREGEILWCMPCIPTLAEDIVEHVVARPGRTPCGWMPVTPDVATVLHLTVFGFLMGARDSRFVSHHFRFQPRQEVHGQ